MPACRLQAHKVVHSGYRWIAGLGLFAIAAGYGALLFVWRNHRSDYFPLQCNYLMMACSDAEFGCCHAVDTRGDISSGRYDGVCKSLVSFRQ